MKYGNTLLWTAKARFAKKAISQASSLYTVSFLSGEDLGNKPTVAHIAYVRLCPIHKLAS